MKWIAFYNKINGKRLAAITSKDTFPGEVKATLELLAYENGIKGSDIEVKRE